MGMRMGRKKGKEDEEDGARRALSCGQTLCLGLIIRVQGSRTSSHENPEP